MVRITVRVQPRSSRDQVVGFRGDVLQLRVTAPPVDGKASQAIVVLLAETLGVSKSCVRIVRGHASRDKTVEVDSLSTEDVRVKFSDYGP